MFWLDHLVPISPLFEESLQYRFVVDADEFLSKDAIEEVDVAGMNAEAWTIAK